MKNSNDIPSFVSVVAILLGAYDLIRGFMHTLLLNYSATHIAGLDLSTATASDQLRLLGVFGISNLETGIMLILLGVYARHLALALLGIIPLLYLMGALAIRANSAEHAPSQAQWGGLVPMFFYMAISLSSFVLGLVAWWRGRSGQA